MFSTKKVYIHSPWTHCILYKYLFIFQNTKYYISTFYKVENDSVQTEDGEPMETTQVIKVAPMPKKEKGGDPMTVPQEVLDNTIQVENGYFERFLVKPRKYRLRNSIFSSKNQSFYGRSICR